MYILSRLQMTTKGRLIHQKDGIMFHQELFKLGYCGYAWSQNAFQTGVGLRQRKMASLPEENTWRRNSGEEWNDQ